jgi:hypothetical protein
MTPRSPVPLSGKGMAGLLGAAATQLRAWKRSS